jgi:hypothetical protein
MTFRLTSDGCYAYPNFTGLIPPSILWRHSGIFWIDLRIWRFDHLRLCTTYQTLTKSVFSYSKNLKIAVIIIKIDDDNNNNNRLSPTSRSQWPRGPRRGSGAARLLVLRVRSPPEAWMSVVSVVCCQVEDSASGWSFVQRSPNVCGVSECDRDASIMRKPWPTRGCGAMGWGRGLILVHTAVLINRPYRCINKPSIQLY